MKFLSEEQAELAKHYIREAPIQTIAPFAFEKLGEIAVLMNGEVKISNFTTIHGKRYRLQMVLTAKEIVEKEEKEVWLTDNEIAELLNREKVVDKEGKLC